MAFAYCFRSGHIGFCEDLSTVPEGAIVFAEGDARALRERVAVKARHAYDGVTLLVPGVPEAEGERAAMAAFNAWHEWAFAGERIISAEGDRL